MVGLKYFIGTFITVNLNFCRSKVKPEDKLKNGKPKSSGLSRSFSLRWSRRERSKRLTVRSNDLHAFLQRIAFCFVCISKYIEIGGK